MQTTGGGGAGRLPPDGGCPTVALEPPLTMITKPLGFEGFTVENAQEIWAWPGQAAATRLNSRAPDSVFLRFMRKVEICE